MSDIPQKIDFVALRATELEPYVAHLHGNRFAHIVAVKGEPGKAELAGRPPFFEKDGEAFEAALVSLGLPANCWCGVAPNLPHSTLSAGQLRFIVETIDPTTLVALDTKGAALIQACYGSELLPKIPKPGQRTRLLGRTLVFVDGFEAALASASHDGEEAKRRVWRELKALKD